VLVAFHGNGSVSSIYNSNKEKLIASSYTGQPKFGLRVRTDKDQREESAFCCNRLKVFAGPYISKITGLDQDKWWMCTGGAALEEGEPFIVAYGIFSLFNELLYIWVAIPVSMLKKDSL
jgi:hypothetical protein